MNNTTFIITPIRLALLVAGIGLAPASYAANLAAVQGQWTPPGGTPITMWGFTSDPVFAAPATGVCPVTPVSWDVGPVLTDTDLVAGDLTIHLRNCLSEPVSIIIPGQSATFTPVRNGNRVASFTAEAAANGGTASYIWSNVKEGTYLYQSGSHPARQVQMGLYGALTVGSYPGTSGDVTLLYSEIDPVLHSPPAAATPLGYHPRHYLVNGSVSQPTLSAGDANQPTVLRFLNAGLDFHVPALNGGYMSIEAEDGNKYPFAKQQYSVNLPAGKTIDALWQPKTDGTHVIYDRRGNGMLASLTVGVSASMPPVVADDAYATAEDSVLSIASPGVLVNDDSGLTAILVTAPSSGTLSPNLSADGSFTYTPNANFNGVDSFTYRGNDGTLDSNITNVSITVNPVNDAPVAVLNDLSATVNIPVTLDGTNSSDVDGDALTYQWDFDYDGLTFNVNSAGAMPVNTYTAVGSFTVALIVNDGTDDSTTATATVNVGPAVNNPPVAVEDIATVLRRSRNNFINLNDNDTDEDGNLKIAGIVAAGQISITTGAMTTRGGSVTVVDNGVEYTPNRRFIGTDTFNYTVSDLDGAVSNEITVRVNVVRRL